MEEKKSILGTREVLLNTYIYQLLSENAHSYQRMQALAICCAFMPALKKLYGVGTEGYKRGLQRHLMYFNTQSIWGTAALGVALAMEEDFVLQGVTDQDQIDAAVNGIKVGLMGPFAGVGDTVDWGTLQYLFIGIGMSMIADGNYVPAFFMVAFMYGIVTYIEAGIIQTIAYRAGRTAISNLFASGLINKIILCTSIIGLWMMGALGSTYCRFTFAIETAQTIADAFAPNLMPLLIIFVVYWIIGKKQVPVVWTALGIVVVSMLLALLGIA